MATLGVDIGGANIKFSTADGFAHAIAFPIWKDKTELTDHLRQVLGMTPVFNRVAITMTAELADCFGTKSEGVRFILAAVKEVFSEYPCLVYTHDGELLDLDAAVLKPQSVAAANWHSLATFGLRWFPNKSGLLVDVGSTTIDVIPIKNGQLATNSKTDLDRLVRRELVYMGVERTPICGLVDEIQFRGETCPVANEWFATSLDVFLVLGLIDEAPENHGTADNCAATREFAKTRLARMVCSDGDSVTWTEINEMARQIYAKMVKKMAAAVTKVVQHNGIASDLAVICGHGDYLAEAALDAAGVSTHREYLADLVGTNASRCAPAYGLAVIADQKWS